MGLNSARKIMKNKRKFRWSDHAYKNKVLNLYAKADPLEEQVRLKGL